jgi:predicted lactoylglutathione lyase
MAGSNSRKIFVNLAVEDLDRSVDFFDRDGVHVRRSFQDLDGHLWELIWMDPSALES